MYKTKKPAVQSGLCFMLFNKIASHSRGNSRCMPPMFVVCVFHCEGKYKVGFMRIPNDGRRFRRIKQAGWRRFYCSSTGVSAFSGLGPRRWMIKPLRKLRRIWSPHSM